MAEDRKCPVHRIPDCSPLLNGCTWRPVPVPTLGSAEVSYVDGFDVDPEGNVLDGTQSVETPAGGSAPADGVAPGGSEPTSPPAGPRLPEMAQVRPAVAQMFSEHEPASTAGMAGHARPHFWMCSCGAWGHGENGHREHLIDALSDVVTPPGEGADRG